MLGLHPRRRLRRLARTLNPRTLALLVFAGAAVASFPGAASAAVTPMSANLETSDFSQFNLGGQTSGSNASLAVDNSTAYDGTHSGKAYYPGGGSNAYARGVESVNWNDGDDVWYGEAVYLPVGFKSAMQGEVDLMRGTTTPSTTPATTGAE